MTRYTDAAADKKLSSPLPYSYHTAEWNIVNKTVQSYLPLVDFLQVVLGSNSEIVLHDFSDLDHAVVDIRNGHVSGRSVGAPATDLALKVVAGAYADRPFISGYASRGASGKALRSASFFIREGKTCVGMLCVNTDTGAFTQAQAALEQLLDAYGMGTESSKREATGAIATVPAPAPTAPSAGAHETESLSRSSGDLVAETIAGIAADRGLDLTRLSQAERVEIVRELEGRGLFLLKGAVAAAARALGISEPSIYRYLQQIRKK